MIKRSDTSQSKLEWRHKMPYKEFLDAVIDHELKLMEKWSTLHKSTHEYGCRALTNCRDCDYKTINTRWQNAVKKHKERTASKDWTTTWLTWSNIYHTNMGCVLQCLSVAYGIKRKEGFITQKAIELTNKILSRNQ